jgi:hypothetical protein
MASRQRRRRSLQISWMMTDGICIVQVIRTWHARSIGSLRRPYDEIPDLGPSVKFQSLRCGGTMTAASFDRVPRTDLRWESEPAA